MLPPTNTQSKGFPNTNGADVATLAAVCRRVQVSIHPGRQHTPEPSFKTFDECMGYYLNTDTKATGLTVSQPSPSPSLPPTPTPTQPHP